MRPALLLAGFLTLAAAVVAGFYFISPHADLRVTTGPPGAAAQRFMTAFAAAEHPRVHMRLIEVPDLAAGARAIEDRRADLGIVRTDVNPPTNGQTIAILRRDVIAFILPPKSPIDKIAKLYGKTIVIPESPQQGYDEQALDNILSYYDIPADKVNRIFAPVAEIGRVVREKRAAAVLAIGPIGPGQVVDVVGAMKASHKGAPEMLAIDEAEAISKRFPGFESIDVPTGAFRGAPPTPDDTTTSLAVTYRLVAPMTMLDITAGAIAQSIFTTKSRLMAKTPTAAQIEAPDPDDKNPILPVHPGVAAYLNSGVQSFFDEFQQYFYIGGMAVSVLGSAIALVIGRMGRRQSQAALMQIDRLIAIAGKALAAQPAEVEELDRELGAIIAWFVKGQVRAGLDATVFSVAISHARNAIERRRAALSVRMGENPVADRMREAKV